jgi:hypothetical protein
MTIRDSVIQKVRQNTQALDILSTADLINIGKKQPVRRSLKLLATLPDSAPTMSLL